MSTSQSPAQGGVVDLLERVLQRGAVLHADVLITLSGVPLVGINLRAAIAGAETMIRYGMMTDWILAPSRRSSTDEGGR